MDIQKRIAEIHLPDVKLPGVLTEFRTFLTRSNALALAVGVIVGAATGKVVTTIVDDVLMPVVGLVLPHGDWREAKVVLSSGADANGKVTENAIRYGHLIGTAVDFVLVAAVVFLVTKWILRTDTVPTRPCPECREPVSAAAKRCRACTSPLPAA